jgi:hypothetical protein
MNTGNNNGENGKFSGDSGTVNHRHNTCLNFHSVIPTRLCFCLCSKLCPLLSNSDRAEKDDERLTLGYDCIMLSVVRIN